MRLRTIEYRPEIDSLRAIAVFAVIIFHSRLPFLKGGFLGVDIFFVISGYLISSIIFTELKENNFKLISFYERRSRRILPALFVVVTTTIFLGNIFLSNIDYIDLVNSALTTIFFSSNLYFYFTGLVYGAQSTELLPLSHTWSLGIEEQFYIIFPILILIYYRFNYRNFMISLFIFIFSSLIFAEWISFRNPSFNFYMPFSRVWELCFGSVIAKYEIDYKFQFNKYLRLILSLIGILLISYSLFFLKEDRNPNLHTLIPVIGTGLIIIFCKKGDFLTNLLSNRLSVYLGKISYSLYLWHQPIFSYAFILSLLDGSIYKKAMVGILLIVISMLTFHVIEKPFRNKVKIKLRFFILIIIGFLLISVTFIIHSISNRDMSYSLFSINDHIKTKRKLENKLFVRPQWNILNEDGETWKFFNPEKNCYNRKSDFCSFNKSKEKNIFLMGDSSIASLQYPLVKSNKLKDYQIHLLINSACPYLPNFNAFSIEENDIMNVCDKVVQQNRREIILKKKNSIIIIGGQFSTYFSGLNYKKNGKWSRHNQVFLKHGKKYDQTEYQRLMFVEYLRFNIEELLENGNKVLIVYPIPETDVNVAKRIRALNGLKLLNNKDFTQYKFTTTLDEFNQRNKEVYNFFNSIKSKNIIRVFPSDFFCDSKTKTCLSHKDGKVFYHDPVHVNLYGAQEIVNLIEKKIIKDN
jgi:peptidoglycan/LPS O-acetylase OafA/YrhL